MKIDPTAPSVPYQPLASVSDPLTQLFQTLAPHWQWAQGRLFDTRVVIAVLAAASFTFIFYRIFFPEKKETLVDLYANKSFEELLKIAVLEANSNELSKHINQKCENNQQMLTVFGSLLKDNQVLNLSMDELISKFNVAQMSENASYYLIIELMWKKMGTERVTIDKANLPWPLLYAKCVQNVIDNVPLSKGTVDPTIDAFFWALVCQRAPKDTRVAEWQEKAASCLKQLQIRTLTSQQIVDDLITQNSAEPGWTQQRLDAYRYLASLESQQKK
ncbi:MAG: hypothetical protein JSR58_06160 [Verrucomicrobia bacterium]|nr:hypothetical protein [Verrucomicrobiota bacterium]